MRGTVAPLNPSARPVGLTWLCEKLRLNVPPPAVRSEIVDGGRSSHFFEGQVVERYPKQYEPSDLYGHIRFALKYEPLDLRVLKAAFESLGGGTIVEWMKRQPTGGYSRRAWYLYEALLHSLEEIPNATRGAYVDLADSKTQVVGNRVSLARQRVVDNLLGGPSYAPLIRLTPRLQEWMEAPLKERAARLLENVDPALLARASQYLYTRETKSSFAIERSEPPRTYLERFIHLLGAADDFDLTKLDLIALQNQIVDPRFWEKDWRDKQNYVGETRADYQEVAHFVCPKPEDVAILMSGWEWSLGWMTSCHPVVAAAAASFGFVLIHPFIDGNGRIHRFLIHAILAKRGFTPEGIVFPVSAVMLRHRREYEKLLDAHADTLMPYVDYILHGPGDLNVLNSTIDLYRYPDLTTFAEYLFECIEETIEHDLAEELGFLTRFDAARAALREIVDLPDVQARLLLNLLLQNNGKLSKKKRKDFAMLTDEEVLAIERAIEPLTT